METTFNWTRLAAVMLKEFIQLRRDRLTFALMVVMPIIQLTLFGFAINSDPKHLPTAIVAHDHGTFTRSLVAGLSNSGYFDIVDANAGDAEAGRMLALGTVQFVVTIPSNFSRKLTRGERPAILIEGDATDPAATSNAIAAIQSLATTVLRHDLKGPLAALNPTAPPFEVILHRRYNPEGITGYNVVPGLMGVILTMTMIMMTALGVTREVERGTMENLLATPVRALEVLLGKICPYILIGYVQVAVILVAAKWVFDVPFVGGIALLLFSILIFIAANLTVGAAISSAARNQTQAMQLTFFFFLPSMLLSGFMFPFRGMPQWAQAIGEALPLTHFLRLVRGIMLKGNEMVEAWTHMWPLLLFMAVMMAIGLLFFRTTLD